MTPINESTQPYREIRALLGRLVASWPWDRPGTAFENAKAYPDFHCADCGRTLSVHDLAVVLELEMLRVGTVDAHKVPYYAPICTRCYIAQAALACEVIDQTTLPLSRVAAGLLTDRHSDVAAEDAEQGEHQANAVEQWQHPASPMRDQHTGATDHRQHEERAPALSETRRQRMWPLRTKQSWLVTIGVVLIGILLGLLLLALRSGTPTLHILAHPAMILAVPERLVWSQKACLLACAG